ncbi:ATP-binding protein [Saccharothrix sp. NRRL B-16348]|uniref:ATP-binding protein n=1 Tax=Saccharothrix sp. NRRL B-16348 TaxID=1415542 RepID=UPI0006ADE0B6|nr:tetratricopeptide repeat protein [Saccharothrix sp. NRRL B-16348]
MADLPLPSSALPHAVHRSILVVDVEGFGDRRRTNHDQLAVRAGVYRALQSAFSRAGVPWARCHREDRGDAVFVLVPPEVPKAVLVEALPTALAAAIRDHNETCEAGGRFRLRMALHAGEVNYDEHGVTAAAVNHTFRLSDATALRAALARSPGVLALITSDWFYDEVVRHSRRVDPGTFRPFRITVKETHATGWVSLPDAPYPSATPSSGHRADAVIPRQLPALPHSFTGRADELASLTALLDRDVTGGGAVVVSAIGGAGGIGKTWLVLQWAHQHLHRFPDGQLFVDLAGFSPDSEPMHPMVAVRGFLDALGVEPGRIPVDPHAQTALFRSMVADRRLLVVLDNAVDTAQVIPLLPGSPTSTVLVTSRNRLTGLITRHGARHLDLNVFAADDALAMLTDRLGAERVRTDTGAIDELIALCGGLPLALSILAGRAGLSSPLSDLVAELRESGLAAFDDQDPDTGLPAVFSWSHRALQLEEAVAFALLGIAPGPDISLPAAVNLLGLPRVETRSVLRGLERASLLTRTAAGRYRMHDLIRQFAVQHASSLPERQREQALMRVVDFYLHTAHNADRLLYPQRRVEQPATPSGGCRPLPLTDLPAAWQWLTEEHHCLLAAQHTAVLNHLHHTTWQLAWVNDTFHFQQGHIHDEITMWRAGLAAAEHLDSHAMIVANRHLGRALTRIGRHEEGLSLLRQALLLAERAGDVANQANTHRSLAWVWERNGDDHRALQHATRSLEAYRTLDNPTRTMLALNEVGWYAAKLGDLDRGRELCQTVLDYHRGNGYHRGEATTLHALGYINHHTGRHRDAVEHYQRALALRRDIGHLYAAAETLDMLGHPHVALRQYDQAQQVWTEAADLYAALNRIEDSARVQRELKALPTHRHRDDK